MAEPTFYLFDGFNLMHAGTFRDVRELTDTLASFVATRGARGVVVFDGVGADEHLGPLEVRYASNADALLERLASDLREREQICLVSSDVLVRNTSGQEVGKMSSRTFLRELPPTPRHEESRRMQVADRLDPEVRARLEELRRGREPRPD
jgi:predicted RNA-binding protein with PIN domain